MRAHRAVAAAVTAILAVGLAACTGGGDDPPVDATPDDGPPMGVLDQLVAAYEIDSNEVARQIRIEELIAECMHEAGFDYTPVDYSSQLDRVDELPYPDSLEFAKLYGYGVSTDVWGLESAEAQDPNADYVASMSAGERRAYHRALQGDVAGAGPATWAEGYGSDSEARSAWFERHGCTGAAVNQVNTEFLGDDGEWAGLFDEMDLAAAAIVEDPEVVATLGDWADCMAATGYAGYLTPEEPRRHVQTQVAGLDDLTTYESVDLTDTDQDTEALERTVWQEQQQRLRVLRDEEVALATADYTCRETSGYLAAYRAAWVRAQQEFYDTHKEDVDAYVEFLAQNVG